MAEKDAVAEVVEKDVAEVVVEKVVAGGGGGGGGGGGDSFVQIPKPVLAPPVRIPSSMRTRKTQFTIKRRHKTTRRDTLTPTRGTGILPYNPRDFRDISRRRWFVVFQNSSIITFLLFYFYHLREKCVARLISETML